MSGLTEVSISVSKKFAKKWNLAGGFNPFEKYYSNWESSPSLKIRNIWFRKPFLEVPAVEIDVHFHSTGLTPKKFQPKPVAKKNMVPLVTRFFQIMSFLKETLVFLQQIPSRLLGQETVRDKSLLKSQLQNRYVTHSIWNTQNKNRSGKKPPLWLISLKCTQGVWTLLDLNCIYLYV